MLMVVEAFLCCTSKDFKCWVLVPKIATIDQLSCTGCSCGSFGASYGMAGNSLLFQFFFLLFCVGLFKP